MAKSRKFKKHVGTLPIPGPYACWRSVDIKLPCLTCGGKTSPMHSPTRLPGVFCSACCPCCNPALHASAAPGATATPPEGRGAVLADAGAHGGGFNKPFGRRLRVPALGGGRRTT